MDVHLSPKRSRRVVSAPLPGLLLATVVLAAACAPPTVPDPGIVTPAAGHGRDRSTVVAPSGGCTDTGSPLPIGRSTVSLLVDGVPRVSLVDVPEPASGSPRRLLVSLHPFLMGPETWDWYSGLAAAGTRRGFVVVTPLGSEPGPRWTVPGGLASGTDDLAFIGALVDHVEDHACVDRNRVFAAGFSAGAAMAQAL